MSEDITKSEQYLESLQVERDELNEEIQEIEGGLGKLRIVIEGRIPDSVKDTAINAVEEKLRFLERKRNDKTLRINMFTILEQLDKAEQEEVISNNLFFTIKSNFGFIASIAPFRADEELMTDYENIKERLQALEDKRRKQIEPA